MAANQATKSGAFSSLTAWSAQSATRSAQPSPSPKVVPGTPDLQNAAPCAPRPTGLTPEDAARIEQMRLIRERSTRNVHAVRAPAHNAQAIRAESQLKSRSEQNTVAPWADRDRPRGSQFTAEQWAAARAGFPACCVFEFHPGEAAGENAARQATQPILMVVPHARLDAQALPVQLLEGSLVSPRQLQAAGQVVPAGACELVFCYTQPDGQIAQRVMNLVMRDANPWAEVMIGGRFELVMGDPIAGAVERGRMSRDQSPTG